MRITFVVLIVLGGIVGFWELLRLPQLTVTPSTTQIGGSQRISNQEIFAASQVDGRSILLVRPADVAQRVGAVPGIASADVHVRLPNQVLDRRTRTPAAGRLAGDHHHRVALGRWCGGAAGRRAPAADT